MRPLFCWMLVIAVSLVGPGGSHAQSTSDRSDPQARSGDGQRTAASIETEAGNQFKGLSFGIGLGASIDLGGGDPVETVEIVNDTVRVTSGRTSVPRVLLESHYFFVNQGNGGTTAAKWGWGPFVAIQTGGDEIIEAIGAGLMIGFRRVKLVRKVVDGTPGDAGVDTDSFNMGIGALLDNNVRVLRDGVVENGAISGGQTESLTKNTSRWGLLTTFSFSF